MAFAQSSIPQVFPHIIGQKGRTKLKVEQDTGASITIPRKNSTAPPGSREADVVVRAQTQAAAVSAATRLELLIENVLDSNKYGGAAHSLVLDAAQYLTAVSAPLLFVAGWSILTLFLYHLTALRHSQPLRVSKQASWQIEKPLQRRLKSQSLSHQNNYTSQS